MRLAAIECINESNSFSPVATTIDDFIFHDFEQTGVTPEQALGVGSEMAGFIAAAHARGIDVTPLWGGKARSGGNLPAADVAALRARLVDALRRAGPVDGVYLALHGATVGEGCPDVTGVLLADARQVLGAHVPLVCSLDFHANITAAMAAHCDALIVYRTYPHVDCAETGARALRLLAAAASGACQLSNVLVRLPMILPAEATATLWPPMADLIAHLDAAEQTPGIAAASVACVQPWLDVEDLGCSVVIVADGDAAAARAAALAIGRAYWNARHAFRVELTPPAEAVRRALSAPWPVVLADSADGTSSGSTGDSTAVLEQLLAQRAPDPCLVMVVDAAAARAAHQAGVGATLDLSLGGAYDRQRFTPLRVRATVERLSDGHFVGTGPLGRGYHFHMGPAAALRVDGVHIVVASRAEANYGPEPFRSLGLEPAAARIVVVKSPTGFRANFEGIARTIMIVDGPGSTTARLAAIPFTRLRRPFYPLDDVPYDVRIT